MDSLAPPQNFRFVVKTIEMDRNDVSQIRFNRTSFIVGTQNRAEYSHKPSIGSVVSPSSEIEGWNENFESYSPVVRH